MRRNRMQRPLLALDNSTKRDFIHGFMRRPIRSGFVKTLVPDPDTVLRNPCSRVSCSFWDTSSLCKTLVELEIQPLGHLMQLESVQTQTPVAQIITPLTRNYLFCRKNLSATNLSPVFIGSGDRE
jgi:hypothetical protein